MIKTGLILFSTLMVSVLVSLVSTDAEAACPASGAATFAAGTSWDQCGNSTTGGPLNKTCCISSGVTNLLESIYNGGTRTSAYVNNACAQDVVIPGYTATEWTDFVANKPGCITFSNVGANYWVGTTSSLWSVATNWSASSVPGASDVAVFDRNCQANCAAVTVDTAVNVSGIIIDPTFPASTITSNAVSIAVGSYGFFQQSSNVVTWAGTNATSFTVAGPVQILKGSVVGSNTSNAFSSSFSISSNAAFSVNSGSVAITGVLSLSNASYLSTAGSNTFNSSVISVNSTITSGNALTVVGNVSHSSGSWTLASGGVSTFAGTVALNAGTMTAPNAASTTAAFSSTVTIANTAQFNVSSAASVSVVGLLTVTSTSSPAYNSAGTDTFNGGVTLNPTSGGMLTGLLNEKGAVTVTKGTWTCGGGASSLSNFNTDAASLVTINGGVLIPSPTTHFQASSYSLALTSGTFGASSMSGTISFSGNVSVAAAGGTAVTFHNGTANISVTGLTTITDAANTGLVTFGDGLGGTDTFTGGLALSYAGGNTSNNPVFVQGATTLLMSTFTQNTTAGGFGRGSLWSSSASANMSVTSTFNFDCAGSGGTQNLFNGTLGTLEIDGSATITASGCGGGGAGFNIGGSTLKLAGGAQTVTWSYSGGAGSASVASLSTSFSSGAATKTINPFMTVTTDATLSDGGKTGVTTSFASSLIVNGTGNHITINDTGSGTYTFTGGITATNSNMIINASSSSTTITNTGGITIGATSNGSMTLNPTSPGTIILNGPGNYTIDGSLTSNDAGGLVSGNGNVVMSGGQSSVAITLGTTGVFGTTGTFTISKSSQGAIVTLQSSSVNFHTASSTQPFIIGPGTFQLNPTAGVCSGAAVCYFAPGNLTLTTNGVLSCGNSSVIPASGYTFTGGIIDCNGYKFNWTGGAFPDVNWATPTNWGGGSSPSATDYVVFDQNFCTHCAATVSSPSSVGGIGMENAGVTINQNANLTVGSAGFWQLGGTFNGGAATFSDAGDFQVTGGVFNAPSGNTTFSASSAHALNFTNVSSAFSNVTFNTSSVTYTISGTLNMTGTLTLGDSQAAGGVMNGGTISTTGPLAVNHNGYTGNTNLILSGSGAETVTASGGGTYNLPNLTISASSPGSVQFDNNTYVIAGSYVHSGTGTVNYSASSTTMTFAPASSISLSPGSENFYNVNINPSVTATVTTAGTMNVTNSFSMSPTNGTTCTATGGTINITGTAASFNGTAGCSGTTIVQIAGSTTVTDASGALIPTFVVSASSPATVVYANGSNLNFGNNYTYSGTAALTATGSTVSFNQSQSVTAGTVVYNNVTVMKNTTQNPGVLTLADTMNINGLLDIGANSGGTSCTFTKGAGAGILNVVGNANPSVTIEGTSANRGCSGTGIIQMAATSSVTQTITLASAGGTAKIPNFYVTASSPATISFGTNGTYNFVGNYLYTGSAILSATANTTTLEFTGASASVTAGSGNYYNVTFNQGGTDVLSGTMNVTNTATFGNTAETLNGGTINISGATTTFSAAIAGSTALSYSGSAAQTIGLGVANQYNMTGGLTINKASNSVTFSNNTTLNAANAVNLQAGTIKFAGTMTGASSWSASSPASIIGTNGSNVSMGDLYLLGDTYTINGGGGATKLTITTGHAGCSPASYASSSAPYSNTCGGTINP